MFIKFLIAGTPLAAASLVAASVTATAQTSSITFDQAAYVTCREAQALPPDKRMELALFLAEYSARRRGVVVPEGEKGAQIGYLVRGGCTLAPDAYLFTVIDRAIQAEMPQLPKR